CLGGLARPACAATYWWNTTTTGLWSTGTNWSNAATGGTSGTAPANSFGTDDAVFNQTSVNGMTIVELDAARSINGMTFLNTGSTLLRANASGTQTLTLGAKGITVGVGAGPVTIGDANNAVPIVFSTSDRTWTNDSASLLRIVNNVTNSNYYLTVAGNGTGGTRIEGGIAGTGGLLKSGSGTLTLTGANIFSGTIGVSGGTLATGGAGTLGSGTYTDGSRSSSNTITNNAALLFASSANQTFSGVISGTGSLTMAGPGILTLTTANTYTGVTTISSGTLQLGPAGTSNAGSLASQSIVNNGMLIYNTLNTASGTYSGVISGTGAVVKTGGFSTQSVFSSLMLTGSNTFTGPLLVQAGTAALNFTGSTSPLANVLSPSVIVSMGANLGASTPAVPAFGSVIAGTPALLQVRPTTNTYFSVTGSAGAANNQSLTGLTVNDGIAWVNVTAPATGSMTLDVGNLRRSAGSRGAVVLTSTAAGTATVLTTTTNANGIVGPWAIVNTGGVYNWAASAAAGGTSGAVTAYAAYSTGSWAAGANTNITSAVTVPANAVTNSLRFGTNVAMTLAGTNTVTSGGILFSSAGSITGGVLRGPAGDGLQISTAGNGTISSTIVDNGGPTGLTHVPLGGWLALSGNNTFTGRSVLMGAVRLAAVQTGTSGPLGVGGAIEFPANGSIVGGYTLPASGYLSYNSPLTTADYSRRFTTTANQPYGAQVWEYLTVTWASSIGSDTGSLVGQLGGDLLLTGSNNFPYGVHFQTVSTVNPVGGLWGSVTLGSANAVGSVGQIFLGGSQRLRFTAASAGLDLGSRLAMPSSDSLSIDTNGQNVQFASDMSLGGTPGMYKLGGGELKLSGSTSVATSTGFLVVGGTLTVDSAVKPTAMSTSQVQGIGVSTFQYTGASGTTRSQSLNGVTLQSGLLTIAVNNPGTSTTLTTGTATIGRNPAGTVDFRATGGTFGTNAIFQTGTSQVLTNGILGPWATVDGTNWATHTSGTILAYTGYADVAADVLADSGTSNARIASTASGTVTLGAATTTVNTLLQSASTAATVSLQSRALLTGGVMVGKGAAALTIGDSPGSGTLQPASAGGEVILSNFSSGLMTVNSVIANNASASRLTISGTGAVVLTASNTITGTTYIQGGSLRIGAGGTTGALSTTAVVNLAPGATLVYDRTDDYGGAQTYRILGSRAGDGYVGGLILRGGHLTLSPTQVNSYSGFTQLLGGTLSLGTDQKALSVGGDIVFGGGVLRYGATQSTDSISGRIAGSTSPITVDTNNLSVAWNYSLPASNVAGLTKTGLGTLTLGNVNFYQGTTTVTGGILKGAGQSFPGNIVNSSTLAFSNDYLNLPGTYAGVISGTGTVVMDSTSWIPVTLTGTSTFATVPVIQQGRLDIGWSAPAGQPSPLGTSGTVSVGTTGNGGLLGYSGATNLTFDRVVNLAGTTIGGGVAADGAGAFIVTSNVGASGAGSKPFMLAGSGTAANEMRGVIADNGGTNLTNLSKSGGGVWQLTGVNTFSGTVSISEGTLSVPTLTNVGINGPLGSGTGNAAGIRVGSTAAPAALRYTGTGHSTNRGVILTGTGILEAMGSGAATFSTVTGSAGASNTLVLGGTSLANNTLGVISDASGTDLTSVVKD
ncbi:MAG: beta strand repeat-containing protein, partial [Ilumatobacteraceae bacterium]